MNSESLALALEENTPIMPPNHIQNNARCHRPYSGTLTPQYRRKYKASLQESKYNASLRLVAVLEVPGSRYSMNESMYGSTRHAATNRTLEPNLVNHDHARHPPEAKIEEIWATRLRINPGNQTNCLGCIDRTSIQLVIYIMYIESAPAMASSWRESRV